MFFRYGYFAFIEGSTDGINWNQVSPVLSHLQVLNYNPGISFPINTAHEFRIVVINLNNCVIPQSSNKTWICEIDR